MRFEEQEESKNVEDRRGQKSRGAVGGGIGLGALLIIALYMFMGEDPSRVIQQAQRDAQMQQQTQTTAGERGPREDDNLAQFVKMTLKTTEDVWNKIFPNQLQRRYQEPTMVIFDGKVESACGYASAATGPFYCPADQKLYLDLSFYRDIKRKFRVEGDADFALAYVVAHEVAHHVQFLLGITKEVQNRKRRISKTEGNKLSVRLELQADFLAGVWAHHAYKDKKIVIEDGDIKEALDAAHAIGDDRIQKEARGYVVPDSFTHGTSEQRIRWFKKGLMSGDITQGDTFSYRDGEL